MRQRSGLPARRRRPGRVRAALGCSVVASGLALAGRALAGENSAEPAPSEAAAVEPGPVAPVGEAAAAPGGDARQRLEQAVHLYESERYAEALDMFEQVYALEPNPAVLFNIGAAHAALHHCELARDAYRRYIEQTRSEAGRVDAQQQLERLNECDAAPASAVSPAPAASPAPHPESGAAPSTIGLDSSAEAAAAAPAPAATPLSAPQPMATDSPPNAMRVAGWVALGTSGVLALASAGCAYASWRSDDAEGAASPGQSGDAAAREQDAGKRYNALAWGLAGGAAALAGSGLLLLWLGPDEEASVQVAAPGAAGLGLSFERRF